VGVWEQSSNECDEGQDGCNPDRKWRHH